MNKRKKPAGDFNEVVQRGLLIRPPWSSFILHGDLKTGMKKTQEMRTTGTKQRGWVAVIESGTGEISGLMKIADSTGPHSDRELLNMREHHFVSEEEIKDPKYKWRHAWHIEETLPLHRHSAYKHPSGAVIWVKLDAEDCKKLEKSCRDTLNAIEDRAQRTHDLNALKRVKRLRRELGLKR